MSLNTISLFTQMKVLLVLCMAIAFADALEVKQQQKQQ